MRQVVRAVYIASIITHRRPWTHRSTAWRIDVGAKHLPYASACTHILAQMLRPYDVHRMAMYAWKTYGRINVGARRLHSHDRIVANAIKPATIYNLQSPYGVAAHRKPIMLFAVPGATDWRA